MKYSISVALCTYNGIKYIEDQLESILKQSVLPDEIVIGDDCSTDQTLNEIRKLLEKHNYKNYKILNNEINLGVTRNFERTIRSCSKDIILTSDQDDVWDLKKVENISAMFAANKNTSLVFTDARLVDENLNHFKISLWDSLNYKGKSKENFDLLDTLLNRCVITGATMAFKRDFIYKNKISFSKYWLHDGWLGILATVHQEISMIESPLILYRQHDSNVIGANNKTLLKKLISYITNMRNIDEIRINRFNRYNDVLLYMEIHEMFHTKEYNKVKMCRDFWSRKVELKNLSKKKSFLQIFKDWKIGDYSKYYNGNSGMFRDLISSFIS